ncbi:MAG: hypothetical protein COA60_001475 [Robiginitomaculum sp.]|nr:hypothetical protein [Robiginitomaculum sp.]
MSLYSLKLILASFLTLVILTPSGFASSDLPVTVEKALLALETAQSSAPRFSFDRQTYKKGVKIELKTFDPKKPISDRWQVVFPSAEENHSEHNKLQEKYAKWDGNSDKALLIPNLRKRMQEGAKLIRTEENLEIYGFDISDEYILEGGGRKSDIRQHIKGEITIDPSTNAIRQIRYYAPEKFKPISIVSLSQYEIIQHVGPAWEGGPIVRLYETSKVKGNALIKKIRVDEIMINENFKPAS